jgi:tRNA(fMet)-specific endonuclease VapC
MGLILDSSVLIAAERGLFDMEAFVEAEAAMENLFIASVTASEMLHGVHRAAPERRARRDGFVNSLISQTPILSFDLPAAQRHAELWAILEASGNQIGSHDMLIAATCLRFGHRLATLKEEIFGKVNGLELVKARQYTKLL